MGHSMFGRRRVPRRTRPRSWVSSWHACLRRAGREGFWKRCSGPVGETHPKPLAGKRVVVTRALEQSHSLVAALREAGGEAVVLPLVAFAAADNPAELDGYLKGS